MTEAGDRLIAGMKEILDMVRVSEWRCDVTGNPVGADTRMIGAPDCSCQGCRAADKIEGLESDLYNAVGVAYHRGATEFVRLNYPDYFKRFSGG